MKNLLNKIKFKLFGYVSVRANKKTRGTALLSYITTPFKLLPHQHMTDPHSSYWEAKEIVRLLNTHGFDVDIFDWNNDHYIPKKQFSLVIDINHNLERLKDVLPKKCIKVMHIVSASPQFQNQAEMKRLQYLKERTGNIIDLKRKENNSNNALYADYLEGFGNDTTLQSYDYAKKEIFKIPISVTKQFPFIDRDQQKSKRNFLWFGGGGSILKGLDLVLEVFSKNNDLNLSIVGPIKADKGFYNLYKKYFELPNIKLYDRPKLTRDGNILIDKTEAEKFFSNFSSIIYPSASEGTSGAVVQAMHAGLIPIVTRETGLNEDCPSVILENCEIKTIEDKIKYIANRPNEDLGIFSRKVWQYVNENYTKETFSRAYDNFLNKILNESTTN